MGLGAVKQSRYTAEWSNNNVTVDNFLTRPVSSSSSSSSNIFFVVSFPTIKFDFYDNKGKKGGKKITKNLGCRFEG